MLVSAYVFLESVCIGAYATFSVISRSTVVDSIIDLLTEANRQLVNTNYNSPTIKGTNITFSCKDPQLLLEGPDSVTCMENGIWEPDPVWSAYK